jgi:hypothetical protein
MWSWHAHSWITASPSGIGGQVELDRWTRHACEGLLDQQGMSVTSEQGEMLRRATEGWYVSLMKFIEVRKKKESASSFNDFSRVFKPLAELPPKDFEKFLKQSGMNSVEWSMPLAGKLKEFEALSEFSKDDLQTAIEFMGEEQEFLISPEQSGAVIRWWTALRVIEVNTREKSKAVGKEGKVTYCFIPSIQRAIGEYVNQAVAKEDLA